MSEARFWKKLRRHLPPGHYVRVENAVGNGDPDVDFCVRGVEGKIELKWVPKFPALPTTPVLGEHKGLRSSQKVWIETRLHHGGHVIIAVGVKDQVYWFPGSEARQVNTYCQADFPQGVPLSDRQAIQATLRQAMKKSFTRF